MDDRDVTVRELADRIAIDDLLIRYSTATDTRDWSLLDTCFTRDAHLDYTASGGIEGSYPEVRGWLERALAPFAVTVHYVTNSAVELDGDRATARTALYNPMGFKNPDGSLHVFTIGAYYVDELVRTADGWRIAKRVEEAAFLDGTLPAALEIPKK